MSNTDFYKSGEGPTIQPASRNLEEITARELTSTFGASPWKISAGDII